MKRVCIVTAGHLSTCPRMVKAADALHEAGYAVRVVSANYIAWAREADAHLRKNRRWVWNVFDYEKSRARLKYFKTGVRFKLARQWARMSGPEQLPFPLAARAFSRAYPELLRLVLREPADLVYGGTSGGLPVAFAAAQKLGVPFALDLEDFHSAEQDDNLDSRLAHALIARIETLALRHAAFLTAGSQAIADEYASRYAVRPFAMNNVFSLPQQAPDSSLSPAGELRFVWLSQTVGKGRGLEDAVEAIGLAGINASLTLRGSAVAGYLDRLREYAGKVAPKLKLAHFPPSPQADVVDLCRGHDIGLALEQTHVLNRALCLCNKPFTYMIAGLALVFTDTPGQRPLALDLGPGALLYKVGDHKELAAGLKQWANDKDLLVKAKAESWQAAQRRWHWEHPLERGVLLNAVKRALE